MAWIPVLPSHLLHRFWHLRGGGNTISNILLLSSIYGTWSIPWGVFVRISKKIPGLLVCNARKWMQSHKTTINFPFDGRLGPFFCFNENNKNYAVGGEFSWFYLPIKLQKKQRGSQGLNSPMEWIPLLLSHLLHCLWHLRGGQNMISSIFLLSSL